MTSHPKDASDELIDAIASSEKIAKQFHLPVQSGSSRILKLMNRKYDREKYLERAREIKRKNPDVSITTDIIIGFPTETEEDFEDTMSLVREVGYDMIYTFIYSPRVGTVAAGMEGQVEKSVSNERFSRLSDMENEIAQSLNEQYIGKTVRVLSDGFNKNGIPCGRNTQNKIVTFDRPVPAGEFVDVLIETAGAYMLSGKIV
jgi:tRNA-2-methylthio-N6-dimethylallyladenosine synthase